MTLETPVIHASRSGNKRPKNLVADVGGFRCVCAKSRFRRIGSDDMSNDTFEPSLLSSVLS